MPIPIILVPGLLATARLYEAQLPALHPFGPVSIADHAQDDTIEAIAGRVLQSAPARFALAGLSMGAYVALEIVHRAPGRVMKLALLDTSARPDTPAQRKARLGQIAEAEAGRFAELADMIFPFIVHPEREDDDALRAVVRQMAADTGCDAFLRQQKAVLSRPDLRPYLPAIGCPTLVLVGREDALTPPERSLEIASAIGNSRLVVVARCGHLSTLEQPDAVNAALQEWLETE